jgi:hypothetical protein
MSAFTEVSLFVCLLIGGGLAVAFVFFLICAIVRMTEWMLQ